jgi:hypothetical protein
MPFGMVCGLFVYFLNLLYIFSRFGMFYQEKFGNPDHRGKVLSGTETAFMTE